MTNNKTLQLAGFAIIIAIVAYIIYKIELISAMVLPDGKVRIKYKAGFSLSHHDFDFANGDTGTVNISGGFKLVPVFFSDNFYQVQLQNSIGTTLQSVSVTVPTAQVTQVLPTGRVWSPAGALQARLGGNDNVYTAYNYYN
jgi:hypothetical protein